MLFFYCRSRPVGCTPGSARFLRDIPKRPEVEAACNITFYRCKCGWTVCRGDASTATGPSIRSLTPQKNLPSPLATIWKRFNKVSRPLNKVSRPLDKMLRPPNILSRGIDTLSKHHQLIKLPPPHMIRPPTTRYCGLSTPCLAL